MANNYLTFCPTDTGTNLLTQGEYAVASDRTNGNQPGVASSQLVNKAIRQSSFITSQFAQWMSNKLAQDVLDNGSAATILAQMYAALAPNDSFAVENLGFTTSVGSSNLTVALKTQAGSDASSTDVAYIGFRSSVITTGNFIRRALTGALSLTVPSGATLGTVNGVAATLNLYALDNAGTIELAIINGLVDEASLQSTTVMSTGSDSQGVLYSTTSRSNVAVRLIGRIVITEATAGAWASNATELSVLPLISPNSIANARTRVVTTDGSNPGVGGVCYSTSISPFSTASLTPVNVTGLTCTLSTSGRPVELKLVSDFSSNVGAVGISNFNSTSQAIEGYCEIMRSSTFVGGGRMRLDAAALSPGTVQNIDFPPGLIAATDNISAGTYTYLVRMYVSGADMRATANDVRLVAYEI